MREEVATLQDSIETLTLSLVKNEDDVVNKSSHLDMSIHQTPTLVKDCEAVDSGTSEAENSSSLKSMENESSSSVVSDTDNESE